MKILELFEHKTLELTRSALLARLSVDGNQEEAERVIGTLATHRNGELRRVHPLGNDQPAAILVEKLGGENFTLRISSTFFVGIDWIIPGVLAVRVHPKIEKAFQDKNFDEKSQTFEIDVLGMLNKIVAAEFDSIHYEGLISYSSDAMPIPKGGDAIGVRQFLIAEYLALLKHIARKGLRRQYIAHQEVYKRKLRGRILWSKTFSKPSAHLADRIVCEPVGFTRDTDENQYLKAGLRAAGNILGKIPSGLKSKEIRSLFQFVLAAFEEVSDTDESTRPRFVKTNPVFNDYSMAIEMTRRIFAMESVGYARSQNSATVLPHWLYMPKLFELYVYSLIQSAIEPKDKVVYHLNVGKQELDYLLSIQALEPHLKTRFAIADAKYKMIYDKDLSSIARDDARQISGYARFAPVHEKLYEWGMSKELSRNLLPCLVIHPTLNPSAPLSIDFNQIRYSKNWLGFWLLGVRLPEMPKTHSE